MAELVKNFAQFPLIAIKPGNSWIVICPVATGIATMSITLETEVDRGFSAFLCLFLDSNCLFRLGIRILPLCLLLLREGIYLVSLWVGRGCRGGHGVAGKEGDLLNYQKIRKARGYTFTFTSLKNKIQSSIYKKKGSMNLGEFLGGRRGWHKAKPARCQRATNARWAII